MTFFNRTWSARVPILKFTLFKRLVFTLFFITLISGVLGAFWTYSFFQNLILNYAGNVSADAASLVLETFDQKLDEKIFSWKTFFEADEIKNGLRSSNRQFAELDNAATLIQDRDRLWTTGGDDIKESWIVNIFESETALEISKFAEHSNFSEIGHFGIGEMFVANEYGATIFANLKTSDYYQADEEWWQNAMKDGLYVGPIEYDDSTGLHGVTVGIGIYDNEKVIGVAKVFYNLTEAEKIMENIIQTRMMSSKNNSGLIGGRLIDKNFDDIYLFNSNALKADYKNELKRLSGEKKDFFCCTQIIDKGRKKNIILAFANSRGLGVDDRINWSLVLEFDKQILLSPLNDLPLMMLIIVLLVCLLLFFYSFFYISPVVNTLVKLEAAMAKVVAGDLSVRTKISSNDELGSLAHHFDVMVEQLEQATKAKQEFISTATHGLKAPLTGIKWNLEILFEDKSQKISPVTKKVLREIYSTCTQVISTISDVLRVNKLTKLNVHERAESFDPADFVTCFKPSLESLAKSRGREIRFTLAGADMKVFIDKDVFRDIVENLVSNAVKYSKPGDRVQLRLHQLSGQMALEVEDHGIGIPESEQRNLFQEFYRATNAVEKQIEGSGLGLYIAKAEAKAWGGDLSFVSKEDVGSTFMLTLPLRS